MRGTRHLGQDGLQLVIIQPQMPLQQYGQYGAKIGGHREVAILIQGRVGQTGAFFWGFPL